MTILAKIADKLLSLYCEKSQRTIDDVNAQQYGINCPVSDFPSDGNLQIIVLEHYSQFTEDELLKSSSLNCIKKIIYE